MRAFARHALAPILVLLLLGSLRALAADAPGAAVASPESLLEKAEADEARGDYAAAASALTEAVGLSRERETPTLTAVALNNLGNLLVFQEDLDHALARYQEAVAEAVASGNGRLSAQARANAARTAVQLGQTAPGEALLAKALEDAAALPPSREKAFLLVHLGRTSFRIGQRASDRRTAEFLRARETLILASTMALEQGDDRTASYALGYLGEIYEEQHQTEEALALTDRALFAAQAAKAPASLYLWHWQTARLWRAQGRTQDAMAAYRRAVKELEGLRFSLAEGPGGAGTSFRDTVGPVYFGLVDLLLQAASGSEAPARTRELLVEARATMETLKAAEIRDYFHDECVDALHAKVKPLDAVARTEAVVYPIVLPDRLEILVTLPPPVGLVRYTVAVDAQHLVSEVRTFRKLLEKRTTREYLSSAQTLHTWLVAPYADRLAELAVDTLIFVPDGSLRTIPMSALHDGKHFLIERFAVATTPGWNLTDPRPIDRSHIRALLAGLSRSVEGFPALPSVRSEVGTVGETLGGEVLLDQDFRVDSLEQKLTEKPFTVVHIASHGEFHSRSEDSFLLTSDGRLAIDRLGRDVGISRYRDQPLELLTLSGCETAAGDDRAALGLAGIAIEAGARSALGTLWSVDDAAAARLMVAFYRGLAEPDTSRAKALQHAQEAMLAEPRFSHPGYWAAFLLISSWL